MPQALSGLRVASFESRRSVEMAELIRNHGGEPIQAPSMREVPLADQADVHRFGEALFAGHHDVLILLTGVGTRMLVAALATRWPRDEVVAALGRLTLVCRGPKPVGALREVGLAPALTVPEPNTWRDVLAEMDRRLPVQGRAVAVQEYGARNEELVNGLQRRGAQVSTVALYSWALPEDPGPLRDAIERVASGGVDVVLFTSATQVANVFHVATEMGRAEAVAHALGSSVVVASIGPVTTAALEEHGVEPDIHPQRAKMGYLVADVARQAPEVLRRKRARAD
ncbi:MAG TPA: uroporphyrinogen-III synthase [Methylomirabilota bacterium]|nr:uroporphyrinogen-III synthase [Methylomirabilota bacterium]